MNWRIPVGSVKTTGYMAANVANVLDSGWFSPGPMVKEFERLFANAHKVENAIFVNSGTDALRIALASLKEFHGWHDGDEVLVPALTFVATVNTILQVGLKPVFADVDPRTFVWEQHDFMASVTDKTRCVIPVHLFGLPADMPRIKWHSNNAGLSIIEDSCESVGVGFVCQWGSETGFTEEDRKKQEGQVGSFGDFGCFSTYSCHLIVTGVGGLITTHKKELDELARSYANHGRDPYFLGGKSGAGKDPKELIKKRFLYHRIGYSCRGTEFEAAVGIPQILGIHNTIHKRNVVAKAIETGLPPMDFQVQSHPVNRGHARMMFPIVLRDESIDRDEFCLSLEDQGIETRPLFPLLSQPVYQKMWPGLDEKFPVAKRLSERGFYVGCHEHMSESDVDYLVETLKASVRKEVSVAS